MLNATFYLFGSSMGRTFSYPNDRTVELFERALKCTKEPVVIMAHREGALLYYVYLLHLTPNHEVFGAGLALNGVAISDHHALFSFFDRVVNTALFTRGLLTLKESGGIQWAGRSFDDRKSAVQDVINDMASFWTANHPASTGLSAPKLDVKADASCSFEENENPEVFLEATMTIPWVFVTRQQTGIPGLGAWTQHVEKHKAEIEGWQARVKEKEKEISCLKSKKESSSGCIFGFLFLVSCGLIGWLWNGKKRAEGYEEFFHFMVKQRDSLQRARDSLQTELNDVGNQRLYYYNELQKKESENNRLSNENEDLRRRQSAWDSGGLVISNF